jgi:hypothetical protein
VYELEGLRQVYEYEQYPYCRNSVHSKSQRFQNLVAKICDYEPISYQVFANFIAISNDTSNSLIQFYNRSGDNRAAVRTDLIYSDSRSRTQFAIRQGTMVVGSLFNMLCYYQLSPTLSWRLSHNHSQQDASCPALLTIFNKHNAVTKTLRVDYDAFPKPSYWSIKILYLQRVLVFLLLLNTLRLLVGRRSYLDRLTRRKKTMSKNDNNRFEVMVKINSKKQY